MANASGFFGNLGKSISKTADKVAKKTDEFISIQRIRGQVSSLEQQMNGDFKRIGEIIYQKNVNGESFSVEIKELCQEISSIRNEIAACREEIAAKRGDKLCPACGAVSHRMPVSVCNAVSPLAEEVRRRRSRICRNMSNQMPETMQRQVQRAAET